jgi:membrane fusion protein, multidrug efflux system
MEETTATSNNRKKPILMYGGLACAIIGIAFFFFYRQYAATHITTDDAFVEGNIHVVASKVPGTVKLLHIRDNQFVKKGDLLLEVDAVDYEVRAREAQAALDAEKAKLLELGHRIEAAQKQLQEATAAVSTGRANARLQEATLRQARIDMKRAENLVKNEAISKERFDKTKTALEVNEAQVNAAQEHVRQLEASRETQVAVIKQVKTARMAQQAQANARQSSLEAALLNKGYTKLFSPADGYVTKRTVEPGNQIGVGQPLLAVVPLDGIWIVANYKETQLERVKPGQKAEIRIDTYPGKTLKGVVDSIMAGTGASFSLFPPENATGNYVKVVQRIPVKILLDRDSDKGHILRVGMSVEPTILAK